MRDGKNRWKEQWRKIAIIKIIKALQQQKPYRYKTTLTERGGECHKHPHFTATHEQEERREETDERRRSRVGSTDFLYLQNLQIAQCSESSIFNAADVVAVQLSACAHTHTQTHTQMGQMWIRNKSARSTQPCKVTPKQCAWSSRWETPAVSLSHTLIHTLRWKPVQMAAHTPEWSLSPLCRCDTQRKRGEEKETGREDTGVLKWLPPISL